MADERKYIALSEAALGNMVQTLSQPPGGGGTTTGLEARIAKVEADVEHTKEGVREIKSDIRMMLGAAMGAALLLAGMMVAGYFRLSDQITANRTETLGAIQRVQDAVDRLKP